MGTTFGTTDRSRFDVQKGADFIARFNTKLSDFSIAKAKYMGVGVEDEVQVEFVLPAQN